MHLNYILSVIGICLTLSTYAQVSSDTISRVKLSEAVVIGSYSSALKKKSTLNIELLQKEFLDKQFTGNLMKTLEYIPGVNSMDIGAGFSKPMIRGFGFNRIAVSENGIKQEGQQWGADHGLEIDAFNVERVLIRKGPSSLLYGSDAMGGVIEILPPSFPLEDQLFGEFALLGKSVNGTIGTSLKIGFKRKEWLFTSRFSMQDYGDYRVPIDTVVYLTQLMPIHDRRLKNTAGFERNASLFTAYRKNDYQMNIAMSNVYQKMGFFPGLHGVPDASRLESDGNSRNIEMPYSWVNHLKISTHQQYRWNELQLSGDFGYQFNHREEWSAFHTHYASQPLPEIDPEKELAFMLHTFSSSLKLSFLNSSLWENTIGWDTRTQENDIAGYSFLLPKYRHFTTGAYFLTRFRPNDKFSISGGLRYDFAVINAHSFQDPYLTEYLLQQGYEEDVIDSYKWRSYPIDKHFGDYSCSIGMVWNPQLEHLFKVNIGRSFRLPAVNELASNGVHHGTFSHEQGDANLSSEKGWQMDISYSLAMYNIELEISSFVNMLDNYIYLQPTGEWSLLPHAGQIYRYSEAEALFTGGEINLRAKLFSHFDYQFLGAYVHTYNRDIHTALSFSPPLSIRNILTWSQKDYSLHAEHQHISSQNRVTHNEDPTAGANLFHFGGNVSFWGIDLSATIKNVFNTLYYNHLSFYRKVEVPESGRNFQVSIKIPFKNISK